MFGRFIYSILIISTIRQTAVIHPSFVIFWFSQMSFSSSIHNLCLNGFEALYLYEYEFSSTLFCANENVIDLFGDEYKYNKRN